MVNKEIDMIKTIGLSKNYGKFIGISDMNLTVRQGEIFGFLGPNGAGKTTTIRLLLGLMKPTSGEIEILGRNNIQLKSTYMNDIGYLPGDLGLYNDMTGIEYLHHFLKLRKGNKYSESIGKLDSLINLFDINYNKKIATYSKGMKQIIGIIQAFMHDPKLIILDEPTSGLDPIMQEHFYKFLLEEKESGNTIFFSSHILNEVAKVCDRAGIIKDGRLIKVEDIKKNNVKNIRKISISPTSSISEAFSILEEFSGVSNTKIMNDRIEFYYSGDMQMLIKILSQIRIHDLLSESPSLEEAFYAYYKE